MLVIQCEHSSLPAGPGRSTALALPSPGPSPRHSGRAAIHSIPLPGVASHRPPLKRTPRGTSPVLRTVVPKGSQRPRGRFGGKGVDQWLLWQPGLPRWRKEKRRPCSRVAMATQILEASFEDKNHTLPTYIEVPRTPQESRTGWLMFSCSHS